MSQSGAGRRSVSRREIGTLQPGLRSQLMTQPQTDPTDGPQRSRTEETPAARRLRRLVGALLGVGLVTAVVLSWTDWFADPVESGQGSFASAMIPNGPGATDSASLAASSSTDDAGDSSAGSAAGAGADNASPQPTTPDSSKRSGSSSSAESPESQFKQAILGTWEQYRTGYRLLNVQDGGTATIDVKLDGLSALAFGEKVHFDIKWSITGDELVFRTTGGTPKGSVDAITSLYGDKRVYRILDISAKQMLLREGEEDKPPWDRVVPDEPTETAKPKAPMRDEG